MTVSVPISELKQRTGHVLSRAVVQRQDIVIERYGQEYAVILSRERYQELLDAARTRLRERFLEAQRQVYQATEAMPPDEIDRIVTNAIHNSRQQRAGADASCD